MDHVHEFDRGQCILSRPEGFKVEHRFGYALDGAMILLHDVVEILDLADDDLNFSSVIDLVDHRLVRTAFVHRDFFRIADFLYCLVEKPFGGIFVPLCRQEKIDRVAFLVDSAVQIFPDAFDLDSRFIHPPATTDLPLMFSANLFQ
jgi:hypothetical protein